MVDAWAADTAAGADTALLTWRRANLAELNGRAREWMAASGRLSGPEVTIDRVADRAGDQVAARPVGASRSKLSAGLHVAISE
jgi:hypothetical protein